MRGPKFPSPSQSPKRKKNKVNKHPPPLPSPTHSPKPRQQPLPSFHKHPPVLHPLPHPLRIIIPQHKLPPQTLELIRKIPNRILRGEIEYHEPFLGCIFSAGFSICEDVVSPLGDGEGGGGDGSQGLEGTVDECVRMGFAVGEEELPEFADADFRPELLGVGGVLVRFWIRRGGGGGVHLRARVDGLVIVDDAHPRRD